MGKTIDKTATSEPNQDVLAEFEHFNQRGYAFTPIRGGMIGWLLRRVWVIPLSIILVNILLIVTALFLTNNNPSASNIWQTDLMLADSETYLLPFFLIFLCASILYTYFIHRAPNSFYTLAKTKSLIPKASLSGKPHRILPNGSLTYVHDFENTIQSRWGKIFSLIIMIFSFILTYRFAVGRNSINLIQSAFLPLRIGEFILIFIIPLVGGFLAAFCLWVIIVVGIYLSWLTPIFELNIVPYHQDDCGGLKPIGDIALMMALIYIIPGILLGVWAFRGLLGQSIPEVALLTYWLLFLIFILSLISFILPVTRIHREMDRQRKVFQDQYLEKANRKLEGVKNRLRQLVAVGEDQGEEGQALKYDLELLEKLYPRNVVFRTWPFGYAAIAAFAVGQSLQLIPLVSGWVSGALTDILPGGG